MTSKLYVARSTRIAARKLDDEMMIMSAVDSTLFSLNKSATIIWEAADGSSTLEEIVERRICSRFDVSLNDALRDAEECVRELTEHGILLLSEGPLPAATLAKAANA
jgi:Coenzyme PQQ synthesis protein D (PqqD)